MKIKLIPLVLVTFLFSSCAESIASTSPLDSTSQRPSSETSFTTSPSSSSSFSTSISEFISSEMTSTNTSLENPSSLATLNSIWISPMGNVSANEFYEVPQALSPSLNQVNVTIVVAIFNRNDVLIGYAYEAQVDGNAGAKSIRFRVGISANQFAGFTMVSHREHSGFGVITINALRNNLPGKPATMAAVQEVLVSANATRTGKSETYDGMIPAIEAMTLHYSANIG